MQKIRFFEWLDSEEFVRSHFDSPKKYPWEKIEFIENNYHLEQALGAETISIRTMSRIPNEDLVKLKEAGLKKIALRVAGFNMLNVKNATDLGLQVTRVAAYSPESIAEYAMSLILGLERRLFVQREHHENFEEKRNIKSMGNLMNTRRLGLHGYGKIARLLAKIARDGFGMQVSFYDPFFEGDSQDTRFEDVKELYKNSDIISVHIPLTESTKGCINYDLLGQMPANSTFINTARGGVVDSQALLDVFHSGMITNIGVDVWDDADIFQKDLLTPNTFQSYHVAFFTRTSVEQMILQTAESIFDEPRSENILPIDLY